MEFCLRLLRRACRRAHIPLAAGLGVAALAAGAALSPIPLRGLAADPPRPVVVQQESPPSRPPHEARDPKQIATELDEKLQSFQQSHGGMEGSASGRRTSANSVRADTSTARADLAQASSNTLGEIEDDVNAGNSLLYWGASIAQD